MITINLEDGREFIIEAVTPHEAMNLAEGCRQLSGVRQWWRMAMAVAAIRSINGIPMPLPTHEKHIEGMVARFTRAELNKILEVSENVPKVQHRTDVEMAELTSLETLRIWALIGELEIVPGWVAPAFIAAPVRKIGDEKIVFPSTKEEMKALVAKLGLAGMTQASVFMLEQSAAEKAGAADKQAAAKN